MEQNSLHKSLGLVIGALIVLVVLRFIPSFSIGNYEVKKVDLLSDIILKADTVEEELDSILLPVVKQSEDSIRAAHVVFTDSCKPGITCIEDFSDSTNRGMHHFYSAIEELALRKRKVYIAYFGDSFIEADILTSDLRRMLQHQYGGSGVGFIPITSNVAGFRKSVRHSFSGWKSFSVMDKEKNFNSAVEGVTGSYFIPQNNAVVSLGCERQKGVYADSCSEVGVYLRSKSSVDIAMQLNNGKTDSLMIEPSLVLQKIRFNGNIHSLTMKAAGTDSTYFYGISMDGDSGIVLDNYSLRGSSGLNLSSISDKMMSELNRLRPYDLIVLHYGLNVASENQKNYRAYMLGMTKVVEKIKRNFPQAGILIVGISDRDYKNDEGELETMPGVKYLIEYQKNIAIHENVAFWNLYQAMGGESAMVNFVNHKPAWANKDYTHINFLGGKEIARIFYETLVFGKSEYDRKKAYESND